MVSNLKSETAPRRMRTLETGLLNAEILSQLSKTDTPDPNIHVAAVANPEEKNAKGTQA